MKLAFIGIGNVGFAIANNLQQHGYEIIIANDNPESDSVKKAIEKNSAFTVDTIQQAVDRADIVFLATPYEVNETALKGIKFNGKTLVDCTNPVGMGEKGLKHGLDSVRSGAEVVQELAPDAKVVKAFTIYGFENFADVSYPKYTDIKPVMLVAGDYPEAKTELEPLLNAIGYEMKDTGDLSQSLHLEHMTLLWVTMVRVKGHHPNFVWGYMER